MALPHARPLDVIDLQPGKGAPGAAASAPDDPGVSRSILKTGQLQLLRLVTVKKWAKNRVGTIA